MGGGGGGGGGGGKFFITVMCYSEKLSDIIVLEKCEVYSTNKGQYSFCISLNQSQKRAITQSKVCE